MKVGAYSRGTLIAGLRRGDLPMLKATLAAALFAFALPGAASAQTEHVLLQPDKLQWGPQPPALPPGGEAALVSGDPEKPVPYVLRVKLPAGYKIPAHIHPADEHLTVISGSIHVGMGPKLDETKGEKVPTGGYVLMPKSMAHFLWITEPTVLQVHGIGPIEFLYVDPADDPRKK
jgi:quercetin dioxygenase-like cupin family protein